MTETTATNTTARSGGLVGHAFVCLGHHMAQHRLPHPTDVLVDHDPLRITVALRRDAWAAWLGSVIVDAEKNEHAEDPILGRYVVTTWKVRLPDTGVVVTLRARRDVPALVGVSA